MKNSYSGWSKRGTRGYPSEYDGWSHHWEEGKPSDSTKDSERTAEIGNGAEVEIVESRDRNQGCAGTEFAAGTTQASKASDVAVASATKKDTYGRGWENSIACRTTERVALALLIKRTPGVNRAYDLNQRKMQALDTLAEEYEAFEVTMKKVACEHEEGDVLFAMAAEVEELDRAHEEQERLQDELEFTCEGIVTASVQN